MTLTPKEAAFALCELHGWLSLVNLKKASPEAERALAIAVRKLLKMTVNPEYESEAYDHLLQIYSDLVLVQDISIDGKYKEAFKLALKSLDDQQTNMSSISIEEASAALGTSIQFIKLGLRQGIFPFGTAIRGDNGRYAYFISKEKFYKYAKEVEL